MHARALFATLVLVYTFGCQPSVSLEDARAMQSAGDYAGSLVPLREMVDAGSADPEVFYLYGVALSSAGEGDAALWPLRKAMESRDWIVTAGMQIAANAFRASNHDTAIASLGRVLEIEPDHVPALVLRSRARLETRHHLESALADAERALELDPDAGAARVARVVTLLALERVEEAAVALEAIEEFSYEAGPDQPDSARYCGARASFAKEKGETEKADERYSGCLEHFPGSDLLVADALKFYEGLGRTERAVEILEAALADQPDSREFRVALAFRLSASGEHERAERLLREATESANPSLAIGAWADLAGFLIQREKVEPAVEALERALELNPAPTPDLIFRYADTLLAADRFEQALELSETMTVAAHRHLVRGRVHLARSEHALALEEFAAGLLEWPENAVARYYAALAAEGVGNFERAVEEFRYSIRAGASQTDARLRLARLHHAEGAFGLAIEILRHGHATMATNPEMAELELEIIARAGQTGIPPHLANIVKTPGVWQRALVAMARGTNLRSGPDAAARLILDTGADLTDPNNLLLLEAATRYLASADKHAEGIALAEKGLSPHPELAGFHATLGRALLRSEGAAAKARVALERALELEPQHPDALAGLGQLAEASGDASAALDFYLRADAADPDQFAPAQAAVEILVGLGRAADAEWQLRALLERKPYSGPVALRLVELRLARGAGGEERSRVLARLAVRFGGRGPAAIEVLERAASR